MMGAIKGMSIFSARLEPIGLTSFGHSSSKMAHHDRVLYGRFYRSLADITGLGRT